MVKCRNFLGALLPQFESMEKRENKCEQPHTTSISNPRNFYASGNFIRINLVCSLMGVYPQTLVIPWATTLHPQRDEMVCSSHATLKWPVMTGCKRNVGKIVAEFCLQQARTVLMEKWQITVCDIVDILKLYIGIFTCEC